MGVAPALSVPPPGDHMFTSANRGLVLPIFELCINGLMQCVFFHEQLLLFIVRLVRATARQESSFLVPSVSYSMYI